MNSRGTALRTALLAALLLVGTLASLPAQPASALDWPTISRETKPWTRWWWMGSAVEPAHLTAELEAFREAGLGGVEITPIYGAQGFESRDLAYLSREWLERLTHTLREAERIDLGVDLATGTGWPFGGPWVSADDAAKFVAHRTFTLEEGQRLAEPVRFQQERIVRTVRPVPTDKVLEPVEANPILQALALDQVRFSKPLLLHALVAYSDAGAFIDLTPRVGADGRLDWVAPDGKWTLWAIFQGWHGKMVERAAPGGEGLVIDHFSRPSIERYLQRFDRAFEGHDLSSLRAFFNDSYEVDDALGQADWTPAFFADFEERRGYDLRRHLPALFGPDTSEDSTRVLADYRETIADLLLESFTTAWRRWGASKGASVRNQAHGSPASLLDLYAASDIPETEGTDVMRAKWATSAAHVAGRPLVSAETATWLDEHFRSTLANVKRAIDRQFVSGVNHIVYHGTAYSPREEPWPGWLFYAAVHFNPRNPWWRDFATLNHYVTRVQSFLQAGRPDHDVLLYYPLYDALAVRRDPGLLLHFGTERPPTTGTAFESAAETLQARGFTSDFISDRQVLALRTAGDALEIGGTRYRVIVVPAARYLPLATFEHLIALARGGAHVVWLGGLPADVSGLGDLDARRARFAALLAELRFIDAGANGVREASVGKGRVILGSNLETLLTQIGVSRESMVDHGLQFVRRAHGSSRYYFVANWSDRDVDGWIPLGTRTTAVTVFDPMHERRSGARTRPAPAGGLDVYVQLAPGESTVLATGGRPASNVTYRASGEPVSIAGPWTVRFVSGGPDLPSDVQIDRLASWTTFGKEAFQAFSGTARYHAAFPKPPSAVAMWRLDLGTVRDSARVRLNGRDLGTLVGPTFRLLVGRDQLEDRNTLELEVTNLMANRIADLDRRGVVWKKFSNINFPSRLPENRGPNGLFDAAGWAPLESGLLGPVTLTPLAPM